MILPIVLSGLGFVCFEGTWLIVLGRFLGFIGCWAVLLRAVLVMVQLICFFKVRLRLVFGGILRNWLGIDLVLPLLSNLSGPVQHFRAAILGAWRDKVSADLCARKGFRGGPSLDIDGTLQLLDSDHVRERDKALLRGILVGGVWSGFLLGKVRGQDVPCRLLWEA